MSDWRPSAACLDTPPEAFFEDIWPESGSVKMNVEALTTTRESLCRNCPVRRACLDEVMRDEKGADLSDRWGLRGYLTPGERESVKNRGILRCPKCGTVRDPVLLVQGILTCPVKCGRPERIVTPLALNGDQWTKRHTTLSTRIVGWLLDNSDPGDELPTPTQMAELMGGVRRSDVLRVYQVLMEDNTIVREGSKEAPSYRRGDRVASRNWKPNWSDEGESL